MGGVYGEREEEEEAGDMPCEHRHLSDKPFEPMQR